MPQKLWNTDHQYAILDDHTSVAPGEPHDFTDEQIEAGLTGSWSDTDPRAGLKAERDFKRRRQTAAKTDTPEGDSSDENPNPAEPGEDKE